MKKTTFRNLNVRLLALTFVLACLALIIHSCKKDNRVSADTSISNAKSWYESTYPSNNLSRNLSVLSKTGNNSTDFTQYIKPDWNHGSAYNRLGKNAIELPVDPSASISGELRTGIAGNTLYKKSNSKTSFLLLNDGQNYQAYIMTIIADSAYLVNDPGKLAKNTYRHIEKDFTGILYYTTPKGQFVNAWFYKNGTIIKKLSGAGNSVNNSSVLNVKNKNLALNINPGTPGIGKPRVLYEICTTYFIVTFIGDILVDFNNLGTDCVSGDINQTFVNPNDGGAPDPAIPPPPPPIIIIDTLKVPFKVMFCDNSTAAQQSAITNQINAFSTSNCASKFLANYFKGKTFSFCVSDTLMHDNVHFDPVTGSFLYSTDYATGTDFAYLLEHEFFHAFQNAFYTYTGGIESYGSGSPGFVDIEFEQAIFNDITTGENSAFGKGTDDQKTLYNAWITAIRATGTYPNLSDPTSPGYTTFINSYTAFLTQFNAIPDNPYHSTILYLTPMGLINFFAQSTPNC